MPSEASIRDRSEAQKGPHGYPPGPSQRRVNSPVTSSNIRAADSPARRRGESSLVRTRPPDYLPDDLLGRSDFAAACERQDLGAIFRLAVKWGGPGLTPSHLARRCEMSVGRVRDYISNVVEAQSLEVWERVSDGLHIPGAMLGISTRPWENADDLTARPEDRKSVESQRDWIRTRQLLNRHRRELAQAARSLYPESLQVGRTGFLGALLLAA